ncbi:MAG: GHKL domain-containing protein [Streptococcaceae bacterium]|jgi:signal transduction histidine kinase|nr:GHKL domain-containing protein [Streptococcaceae bacterium]
MSYTSVAFLSLVVEWMMAHVFFSKKLHFREINVCFYILASFFVLLYFPAIHLLGIGYAVYIKLICTTGILLFIGMGNNLNFRNSSFWVVALVNIYKLSDFISLSLNTTILFPREELRVTYLPFLLSVYFIQYAIKIFSVLIVKNFAFGREIFPIKAHLQFKAVLLAFFAVSIVVTFPNEQFDLGLLTPISVYDFLIAFCFSFLTIILLYTYKDLMNHFQEHMEVEVQTNALTNELRRLEESHQYDKRLRVFRHDIKNHSLVLTALLEEGKIREAKEYLANTTDKIQGEEVNYAQNSILNYVLRQKLPRAIKNGATITTDIRVPEENIKDVEIFSIVLGNLLDNAISAVERLQNDEEKIIDIKIVESNGNLIVKIRNTFDNQEIISRKNRKEVEGIGRKSIRNFIESNNGIYQERLEGNNIYRVDIVLMNVYQFDKK